MAAFVFTDGVVPAEELARAMNTVMKRQNNQLKAVQNCLKIDERVIAIIHKKTVPESIIFVDRVDNLPFIEAAREVECIKEFDGID
jgi:hypothetical protein